MLKIRNLSNQYQKRTLRVLYGHTQATPYAATLDASLRNTDGSFRRPVAADSAPLDYLVDAYVLQGGLVPGQVMAKGAGESAVLHSGATGVQPWGLLANFVGGTLDDIGDENNIGIWYGKDAVVEILAPAFNDDALAAAYTAATAGVPVPLYAGQDGRLGCLAATLVTDGLPAASIVGYLVERPSASRIVVKLNV